MGLYLGDHHEGIIESKCMQDEKPCEGTRHDGQGGQDAADDQNSYDLSVARLAVQRMVDVQRHGARDGGGKERQLVSCAVILFRLSPLCRFFLLLRFSPRVSAQLTCFIYEWRK